MDVFDRLPSPFGLVRYGVAPDHPKIRSISAALTGVLEHPDVRFLGNVDVGRDISLAELRSYYDAILVASGAAVDRRLGVPGEDLAGSFSATEFVAWYNGHRTHRSTLSPSTPEAWPWWGWATWRSTSYACSPRPLTTCGPPTCPTTCWGARTQPRDGHPHGWPPRPRAGQVHDPRAPRARRDRERRRARRRGGARARPGQRAAAGHSTGDPPKPRCAAGVGDSPAGRQASTGAPAVLATPGRGGRGPGGRSSDRAHPAG